MPQASSRSPRPTSRRGGFTLVELMVVVTIIVLLLTLMVPSLTAMMFIGEDVVCRGQQSQIAKGAIEFALDHSGYLGGNMQASGTLPDEQWFYGCELGAPFSGWVRGTYADYLRVPPGGYTKVYKCPSLYTGIYNSGVGSNGYFDYSCPILWAGARLTLIPSSCQIQDPNIPGVWKTVSNILFYEEDPSLYLNRGFIEMQGQSDDRLGTWHVYNGCNYSAPDGSAVQFRFSAPGPASQITSQMQVRAPSGAIISMSGPNQYKYFNTR